MNNFRLIVGKTGWVASCTIQEDGSVIAIIDDNNGMERDRDRYFPSINELKAYLDSK